MATFDLFSYLPAELRLHIWRQSFQPRAVEVRYLPEKDQCCTITKPPVVLQVCQEAREEALRHYHLAFGTKSHNATIYFNPNIDVLYLPRHRPMGYDETSRDFPSYIPHTAEHIRALAVDHVLPDIKRPWETYNKLRLMMSLPNLKEAYMIISTESGDGEAVAGAEIELIDPKEDQEAILRLMGAIEETFSHEISEIAVDKDELDLKHDLALDDTVIEHDVSSTHLSATQRQQHDQYQQQQLSFPILVPKAKISHGWEKHRALVKCV